MGPERMDSQTQMSIYCRRWRPSKHEVGPFEEVIVSDTRKQCLQESVSLKFLCISDVYNLNNVPVYKIYNYVYIYIYI